MVQKMVVSAAVLMTLLVVTQAFPQSHPGQAAKITVNEAEKDLKTESTFGFGYGGYGYGGLYGGWGYGYPYGGGYGYGYPYGYAVGYPYGGYGGLYGYPFYR